MIPSDFLPHAALKSVPLCFFRYCIPKLYQQPGPAPLSVPKLREGYMYTYIPICIFLSVGLTLIK
jgi:hypothetical protein